MNINSDHNFDNNDAPCAAEVMDNGMDFIFEKLIEPMKEKLSAEDMRMISIIGIAFRIVADQATSFEKSQQGNGNQQDFFRN